MKTLPIQPLLDSYWQDVYSQLQKAFYYIAFAPVVEILRKATPLGKDIVELTNAGGNMMALRAALRCGRVQYVDGAFSGEFNVAISRDLRAIGAAFDSRSGVYRLAQEYVPEWIRAEAASYFTKARKTHEMIELKLNDVQENLDDIVLKHMVDADETVSRIQSGFKKSAELLQVQPKLSPDASEGLAKNYSKNLSLYVKDFSKESILALRELTKSNALKGYRFDKLAEMVRHRYGITANKAKFLAQQETSLFMAEFRKQRFSQAGVKRYRWRTAHDERVRSMHRGLDGMIFSYDQPPITNAKGERNNPGQDFRCRCLDVPLLEKDPAFI